ncbi:hypothetical protein [Salinibacter ruber]|uniref:hypothetical protein n=1 Tax=Salinibacter ruber TaxID=146919 RepID=UPI002169440A|nr:hypothetical protein [Salinibacter ruber]MCS4174576.1 hypothetical protein [Salinibacter ruber]
MKNPLMGAGSNKKAGNPASDESRSDRSTSDIDELLGLVRETGAPGDIYQNIETLGAASKAEYGRVRAQLKEATGVNLNQLDAAVREARDEINEKRKEEAREARREEAKAADTPTVQVTGRPSSEVVDDLSAALESANEPPRLFRREGEIVRPRTDEEGRVQVEEVSHAWFDDFLSRCTRCVDVGYEPHDPSQRLVERVVERVDLPPLRGITQVPFLRPDGTVFSDPGYDGDTRRLYHPDEEQDLDSIPAQPTTADVEEARELLREAWWDHPFDGEASRSNMAGLALTPVVRPLLEDANVPLGIIDAPRAGSGKDLAGQIAALASTGQFPGTMSDPSTKSEWRKQITAQLVRGERFVLVSDVTGTIDNAPLRRVLTTPTWSDRILGATRQVRLPANAVWCATGNNLRPQGDMVRRCFLIRLDTEMQRPWTRSGFRHQQPQWAREHRSELAGALLTLARAWIAAGQPDPDTPTLGSFEEWCRVVGGILQNAGFEDFLGNQDGLTDTEFSEDDRWSLLLEAIHDWQLESLDGEPFTARTLADEIENCRGSIDFRSGPNLDVSMDSDSSLIEPIANHLPEQIQRKVRQGEPFAQSLGKTFGWKKDRRFPGGWFLGREGKGREGTLWTVRRDKNPDAKITAEDDQRGTAKEREGGGDDLADDEDLSSHRHERREEPPF